MKNDIMRSLKLFAIAGAMSLSACTGMFDNIPPYEATEEMLEGDNVKVGAFFPQMQRNVISTHNNQFQLSQNLVGDIYSGYMATPTAFNQNKNNATYFFQDNWLNSPFEKVYTQSIGAYLEIKKSVDGDETSHIYQWAQILKVASMHRFADMWGAVPYTKVGSGSMSTPYDSLEEAYMQFFKDLDKAIEVLTNFVVNNPDSRPMIEYDLVYDGNYLKWIKFANSLRLRLAVRLAYIKPDVARAEAEKAINHPFGIISSNDDNPGVHSVGAYEVINQLHTMWSNYQDIRMGASIQSIMSGYNDPRLPKMFIEGKIGEETGFFGLRTGLLLSSDKNPRMGFSAPNVMSDDPIIWMTAAEVAFLKAEGALRGWAMGTTAKDAYEQGIKLSFEQWKASGYEEYISDSESVPADYKDPLNSSNNINAVSHITIAWDDTASKNENLERIITQRWIAMFPNGQEAWSEYRRTGYPKIFPVKANLSDGRSISTEIQIRRLPFAISEYTLNPENIANAVEIIGGQDNGGIRVWWDVEDKNIN